MKSFNFRSGGVAGICFAVSCLVPSRCFVGSYITYSKEARTSTRFLKVPLNELYMYFTNSSRAPEVLETSFVVDLNPVEQPFNETEVATFVHSLSYFFELIFQAQNEFDIHVHSTEITNQQVSVDHTLSLNTAVDCIFQPKGDQALSNQDIQHILVHVINRYQSHLVKYLHRQQSDFVSIETAFAHSMSFSSSSSSTARDSERSIGLIVAISVASLLLVISLSASWVLYKRQLRQHEGRATETIFRRYMRHSQVTPLDPSRENLSPFQDKEETFAPQGPPTLPTERLALNEPERVRFESHPPSSSPVDQDGAMETIEFGFSQGEPRPLQSRRSQHTNDCFSSQKNDIEHEATTKLLSLDIPSLSPSQGLHATRDEEVTTMLRPSQLPEADETLLFYQTDEETPVGSRFEIYAPPGKLGVAIDTVNGQPVVYRVKPGSPLHGFLRKMDRIIAIDDIDTSHLSAADVTNLMVKNMTKRRKITYIRGNAVFA